MPNLLGIFQHCRERPLRVMVRAHTLQELCPWSSDGHLKFPVEENQDSLPHFLPLVSPIIISTCLWRGPEISQEEFLPSLDDRELEWRKREACLLLMSGYSLDLTSEK